MAIEYDSECLAAQNEIDIDLPSYDLTVLVSEVNMLTKQTTMNILAIGQRLTQIRSIVGHGSFEEYIRTNCGYSVRVAQRFMKIASEYTVETLPQGIGIGKLTELLSLPAADRDDFIQTHDVESLTVRELRAQIAQEKERAAQAEAARKAAEEREQTLAIRNNRLKTENQEAKQQARTNLERAIRGERDAERSRKYSDDMIAENNRLRDELNKAPAADAEAVAAAAQAAADQREQEVAERYAAQLAEVSARADAAEDEAQRLREQMETSEAESAVSLNSVTMLIGEMVTTLNGLREVLTDGAWNATYELEQGWLELSHLELSKVRGVLLSAQEAILRNVPDFEEENDE